MTATVWLELVCIAFNAGAIYMLIKVHGSEIKSLKHSRDRHDREIGVLYGHVELPREVRS